MQDMYIKMIDHLHDGVYYMDKQRVIKLWNTAAESITGYSREEILGKSCPQTLLEHIDEEGRPLCEMNCPVVEAMNDGKRRSQHVFVRHKNGYRIPVLVTAIPLEEDGEIIGAMEIFSQSSPAVYEDDLIGRLSEIAMHDSLTKLPNRRYLESHMDYVLGEYRRMGQLFMVLFADVDDFSGFNDQYGHEMGDQILKLIAAHMEESMQEGDLVGRWGGEEFVGIYKLEKPEEAHERAESFLTLVACAGMPGKEKPMCVTVSVGATIVREGDTIPAILRRADRLMYQSKNEGKNRISLDV